MYRSIPNVGGVAAVGMRAARWWVSGGSVVVVRVGWWCTPRDRATPRRFVVGAVSAVAMRVGAGDAAAAGRAVRRGAVRVSLPAVGVRRVGV